MNTIVIAPEVLAFVAAVRTRLADLEPEELLEITDGLEADLTELVTDQGLDALGDPVAYAQELRAAAGLSESAAKIRQPIRVSLVAFLDACQTRGDALLARLPWDTSALLTWARPLWWVLRAWVAVQLVQVSFGENSWSGSDLVPHMRGTGWLVMVVAVAASVWIGRRWLGIRATAGLGLRTALLAANMFAVVMLPVVLGQVESGSDDAYWQGYMDAMPAESDGPDASAGVYANGRWVSNIYPYDATGKPLVGVQLFDQTGKPVSVVTATECVYDAAGEQLGAGRVYYPWSDGAAQKRNVFPVPSKVSGEDTPDPDPMAFAGAEKPQVSGFPFANVPKISLPGLVTSTGETPTAAFVPGPRVGPINPIDNGC